MDDLIFGLNLSGLTLQLLGLMVLGFGIVGDRLMGYEAARVWTMMLGRLVPNLIGDSWVLVPGLKSLVEAADAPAQPSPLLNRGPAVMALIGLTLLSLGPAVGLYIIVILWYTIDLGISSWGLVIWASVLAWINLISLPTQYRHERDRPPHVLHYCTKRFLLNWTKSPWVAAKVLILFVVYALMHCWAWLMKIDLTNPQARTVYYSAYSVIALAISTLLLIFGLVGERI
jgi:hypothetical protein